ncbi:MAG: hypothetical protein ABI330_08430 [Caldimonas sp.]|nr:hypothetical protein [Pseudomonadota bacterium]
MNSSAGRLFGWIMLASLALAASACSTLRPPGALPIGTSIDEARHSYGGPTGQYPLPGGGTRLEFAMGSFGKQTFMLDFDAGGHLVANQQVLTPDVFATIKPGMSPVDVLSRIGRPASIFPIGWQQLQVWNYRFGGLEGDCVLFQVSISNQSRVVTDAGQGYDPACDAGSTGRD